MVYRPQTDTPPPVAGVDEAPDERESVWLTVDGERVPVDKRILVLGRGQECDVQLSDPNVSRRHAELRQEEMSYWIVDLGSTNGMEVNGRRLRQAKLEGGDRITLGSTDVVFERELQ
jgi:pSer/pThr/pTyr-binding forkhead associated (FHA) protein